MNVEEVQAYVLPKHSKYLHIFIFIFSLFLVYKLQIKIQFQGNLKLAINLFAGWIKSYLTSISRKCVSHIVHSL